MATTDFPDAPNVGDRYIDQSTLREFEWDGSAWVFLQYASNPAGQPVPVINTPVTPRIVGSDFPNNPTVGMTYSFGGDTWEWDGVSWVGVYQNQIDWGQIQNVPDFDSIYINADTDTMRGKLYLDSDAVDPLEPVTLQQYTAGQTAQDADLAAHEARTDNPHSVTAAQLGAALTGHTHVEADITDLAHFDTMLKLTDTPAAYAGASGKVLAVNQAEDGVEFVDPSGAGQFVAKAGDTMTGPLVLDRNGAAIPPAILYSDSAGDWLTIAASRNPTIPVSPNEVWSMLTVPGASFSPSNGGAAVEPYLVLGATAYSTVEYQASSTGRHDFFCGVSNLDATIESNGFYMFGSDGLVTTGRVRFNATIDPASLAVTPTGEIDAGSSAVQISHFNPTGNTLSLRKGGNTTNDTVAYFDADGQAYLSTKRGSGLRIGVNATGDGIWDNRGGGTTLASFQDSNSEKASINNFGRGIFSGVDSNGSLNVTRSTSNIIFLLNTAYHSSRTGVVGIANSDGKLILINAQNNATACRVESGAMTDVSNGAGGQNESVITRNSGDGRYTKISSDAARKTNVAPLGDMLESIMALRPVNFEWLDPDENGAGVKMGLIAQEVEQVLPSAVIGEDGNKGIDVLNLIGALVKAVQEQQETINALTARIERVK